MKQADILKTLKSARLMLYAWRASRIDAGLPDNHRELNDIIREIEETIANNESETPCPNVGLTKATNLGPLNGAVKGAARLTQSTS